MKKAVIGAVGSFAIMSLFCLMIGANVWSAMAIVASSIVFYFVISDAIVDKWGEWSEQTWYYWAMIACLVVGSLVCLMATTWGSASWTLVGLVLVLVGGLIWALAKGILKK